MDPIVLLVAGLIAGWLAGLLMKGSGYGLFGIVASRAEPGGFFGSIIVATIGAVILIFVARPVGAGRTARA